jgi:hypothetical protein
MVKDKIFNASNVNMRVIIKCVRKVAVHLQKVFEVVCTSVYSGLNPFKLLNTTGITL